MGWKSDKVKWILGAGLAMAGLTNIASAAQVSPTPGTQTDHSSTATGAAVTVLTAGAINPGYRTDCFLQNNGTHTMYYSFTGTATVNSKRLESGNVMNCNNGVTVDVQALSLLGTNTEAYVLTETFVSGQ